ncbi:MAG: two-component regulator propeller domain-containing protein, partial [bacterium]
MVGIISNASSRTVPFAFCLAASALLFFLTGISVAQQPPHWRVWKDRNEPPPAPAAGWVSVNRDRSVLLLQWTQGAGTSRFFVTRFDGYEAVSLPKHHDMKMPIPRQGLSGQIWAISLDFPSDPYRTVSIDRYAFGWDLSEGEWFCHDLDDISFLDSGTLPPARVTNLIPISQDRLVILLQDQLIRSDASFENQTILKSSTETGLGHFIHLGQSRDGGLWITGERGLAKATGFDGDTMQWEEVIIPEELGLRDLAIPIEGDFGEVFVTASTIPDGRRVLARFDGSAWEIISFTGAQDAVMGWRGADKTVWAVRADSIIDPFVPIGLRSAGNLNWISPSLWRVQNGEERLVERGGDIVDRFFHVAVEPGGAFWLAQARGLARYAPPTWRRPPGCPEKDNKVSAIYEDSLGRLWFACRDALLCLDGEKWRVFALPENTRGRAAPKHGVCSLPDNRIAFLTSDDQLFLLDPTVEDGAILPVHHPKGRKIMALIPRENQEVWVATTDGESLAIEAFDGNQFKTVLGDRENQHLGESLSDFVETAGGDLWLAGRWGATRYRNGDCEKHEFDDPEQGDRFYSVEEVEDGKIWLGGENKIIEFDGESWRMVTTRLGAIHDIVRRRDGSVWVASHTGIHRYFEKSWISNTDEEGLPTEYLYRLFEDSRGRFWAGTATGFALYHREADLDPPRTYIPPDMNFAETPPRGDVRFVYHGLDKWKYTETDRLMYSHRFDEGPWSAFTSDTVASATGFSPGQHRFEVKAIDRNWNVGNLASFEFTVLVPWYRQPAFLVLFFLGLTTILILLGLHIYHHFNLEKLVNLRTADLRKAYSQLQRMASKLSLTEERERRQLATDLHDSISQSLSVSMMELSAMDQAETVDEVKEQAGTIRGRLDEAFQVTQHLTFNLCPPELYQVGLESAIRELTVRTQKQHGIEIAFDDDGRPKPVSEE